MTTTTDNSKILVDKPEAARMLSLSVREIDESRRRGDLEAKRYGRKVLFEVAALRRFAGGLPSDEPAS